MSASLICDSAIVKGSVFFGAENIVHPSAQIIAENGKIVFGKGNIVREGARIINNSGEPMIIGDYNSFGVDSEFNGSLVASHCVLEAKSCVASGSKLGDRVVVGVKCVVNQVIPCMMSFSLSQYLNLWVIFHTQSYCSRVGRGSGCVAQQIAGIFARSVAQLP